MHHPGARDMIRLLKFLRSAVHGSYMLIRLNDWMIIVWRYFGNHGHIHLAWLTVWGLTTGTVRGLFNSTKDVQDMFSGLQITSRQCASATRALATIGVPPSGCVQSCRKTLMACLTSKCWHKHSAWHVFWLLRAAHHHFKSIVKNKKNPRSSLSSGVSRKYLSQITLHFNSSMSLWSFSALKETFQQNLLRLKVIRP